MVVAMSKNSILLLFYQQYYHALYLLWFPWKKTGGITFGLIHAFCQLH